MNPNRSRNRQPSAVGGVRALVAIFAFHFIATFPTATHAADGVQQSAAYRFSGRPWPIRYFLYVNDAELITRFNARAAETNLQIEKGTDNSLYRDYEEFFPPERILHTPSGKLGIVLLTFAPNGMLLTPKFNRFHFTATKTEIETLVLLKNGTWDKRNKPYHLAWWWELPGKHIMSPAVCDGFDQFRYKTDDPKAKDSIGGFGCREWSAQMQNSDQPYIDVTSYYDAEYHVVSGIVGWSGFENKPKPIIGKHMTTWICLHECPRGEEPGIIHDIQAWSRKHGFPLPKPPERQPEYPNSMFPNINEE
jgi:hypothetical protein